MTYFRLEIEINRVILTGPKLDEAGAHRLRALIQAEMAERLADFPKQIRPFAGEEIRVDLPHLSLETIDGERRVARAAAEAIAQAMRGRKA